MSSCSGRSVGIAVTGRAIAISSSDKAPTYAAALTEVKQESGCPADTQHWQVNYLNNAIEADHGRLKQPIRSALGFKTPH